MYHLSSQSAISRQKFSRESWTKVLSLAIFYGWQPMGTRVPSMTEIHGFDTEYWDGTYLTNDGQIVVAEDEPHVEVAAMVRSVSARGIAFKFLRQAQENKRLLSFIQSHSGSTSSILSKAVAPTAID